MRNLASIVIRSSWLLLALLAVSGCSIAPRAAEPPVIGVVAPAWSLPTLDGTTLDLDSLRGNVVVVNFWATWCGPCVEETPRLVQWHEQYKDDGLRVVGVDALVRDSRDEVTNFVQQYGVTYPIALDGEGTIVAQWLAQQMPRSYVIDREGVVRFARLGGLTQADFDQHIEPLLAH